MLACNMTSLPPELYLHRLWTYFTNHMATTEPYLSCMKAQGLIEKPLQKCHLLIRTVCGNRFAQKGMRQDVCLKKLWTHEPVSVDRGRRSRYSFEAYDKCIVKLHSQVKKCIPRLETPCRVHQIRAIKTVRATMRSVEQLLAKYPNLYVIYSHRDPAPHCAFQTKGRLGKKYLRKTP